MQQVYEQRGMMGVASPESLCATDGGWCIAHKERLPNGKPMPVGALEIGRPLCLTERGNCRAEPSGSPRTPNLAAPLPFLWGTQ